MARAGKARAEGRDTRRRGVRARTGWDGTGAQLPQTRTMGCVMIFLVLGPPRGGIVLSVFVARRQGTGHAWYGEGQVVFQRIVGNDAWLRLRGCFACLLRFI